MKKILKTRIIFLAFAIAIFNSVILADSPLTSTEIHLGYQDEPIVQTAAKTNGVLTRDLQEYLANSKNPIDIKMVVINRISWDESGWKEAGDANANAYFAFLKKKYRYSTRQVFLQKANGDDLLSMAYLMALGNYSNDSKVRNALKYAQKALTKKPTSMTYLLINGLIEAQSGMPSLWCGITERIRTNTNIIRDLRDEGLKGIYDYMDPYGPECGSPKPRAKLVDRKKAQLANPPKAILGLKK